MFVSKRAKELGKMGNVCDARSVGDPNTFESRSRFLFDFRKGVEDSDASTLEGLVCRKSLKPTSSTNLLPPTGLSLHSNSHFSACRNHKTMCSAIRRLLTYSLLGSRIEINHISPLNSLIYLCLESHDMTSSNSIYQSSSPILKKCETNE